MRIIQHPSFKKRSCWRCRDGATALEFALVAPLLFFLLFAVIEMGLIYFAATVLENATATASRIGKTGFAGEMTREEYIVNRIEYLSSGLINPAGLNSTYTYYCSFSDISTPEKGAPGAGGSGDVVVYRVTYPWKIHTPLMQNVLGDSDGIVHLSAVATSRNEQIPDLPSKCPTP